MEINATKEKREEKTRSTNYEGGESFNPATPELRLYRRVINNMLEETFYESDEEQFENLIEAFEECASEDGEFPSQLAAYARDEVGLRDVPQVLLVLSAHNENTKQYVDKYGDKVVQRPDDMGTGIAFNCQRYSSSIPKPLKRIYERAFNSWDEYQFSKYRMESREKSLVDCLNLVRPTPDRKSVV